MDLDKELLARIRAACASDKTSTIGDFQIRAGDVGTVLINLRTGKTQVVYDDDSPLHDLEDLNMPETHKRI